MAQESNPPKQAKEGSNDENREHNHKVKITINGKRYEVNSGPASIKHLKKLANIPQNDVLAKEDHGKNHDLDDEGKVVVHDGDVFVSHKREHDHRPVTIKINGEDYQTHRGENSVAHLKQLGKVPEGEILSQFINGAFVDLADNVSVNILGCEVFASHRPTGGSS